jgi:hypothetical protein
MKVIDLINKLNKLDPETELYMYKSGCRDAPATVSLAEIFINEKTAYIYKSGAGITNGFFAEKMSYCNEMPNGEKKVVTISIKKDYR